LGTVRTSDAASTEDTVLKRLVWNYYNRVLRHGYNLDDSSHTYALEADRIWNNTLSDTMVAFVIGVSEDSAQLSLMAEVSVDTSGEAYVSISKDGSVDDYYAWVISDSTSDLRYSGSMSYLFAAGYHYIYLCESGNTTDDGGIYDEGELNIYLPM
jgi:hypothetical protein